MDIIFINSEYSRTSHPHILIVSLTSKLDLRRGKKSVALSNLRIYYTLKSMKSLCKNNKFETSAPTWNEKCKWPDGSRSASDIQDYIEYI